MNPLSAIRHVGMPEIQPALPANPASATKLAPSIPLEDLEKVSLEFTLDPARKPAQAGPSFVSTLGQLVSEVGSKQAAANEAVTGLLTDKNVPLHQAVIAMEEASVAFQLMVEVRNKLLESYQELMRMQI